VEEDSRRKIKAQKRIPGGPNVPGVPGHPF
jgi:hypothetical protein